MEVLVTSGLLVAGIAALFNRKHIAGHELERIMRLNAIEKDIPAMRDEQYARGFFS